MLTYSTCVGTVLHLYSQRWGRCLTTTWTIIGRDVEEPSTCEDGRFVTLKRSDGQIETHRWASLVQDLKSGDISHLR